MIDPESVIQARRALGRQLAAFRRAAGLSQHELAESLHYGRSSIANVETGRQNVSREFWLQCDEATAADGSLIRAYDQFTALMSQEPTRSLRPGLQPFESLDDAVPGLHRSADTHATSRDLPDTLTAAAGPLVLPDTSLGCRPPTDLNGSGTTGTVAVQAETGWAGMLRRTVLKTPAALTATHLLGVSDERRGDPISPDILCGLVDVAGHYRRAYHAVPASVLLPAVLAHLDLVMSFRPAARSESERVPLVTSVGELAALAGVLVGLDAAQYREAETHFDVAWSAARSVGNVELQTVVLGCRSFILAYGGGDHLAGLECADFARRLGASGACPQTRGWVAAVASERCASLGDLAGCQMRLDESRQALAAPGSAEVMWLGIGGYNAGKLRAYEGGNMMRLRRYRDAQAILDDALRRLEPGMARHRATALLDRAHARLGLDEIDAACDDAAQALELVTRVQHTGHLDRVETLTARASATGSQKAQTLHREVRLARIDHAMSIGKVTG